MSLHGGNKLQFADSQTRVQDVSRSQSIVPFLFIRRVFCINTRGVQGIRFSCDKSRLDRDRTMRFFGFHTDTSLEDARNMYSNILFDKGQNYFDPRFDISIATGEVNGTCVLCSDKISAKQTQIELQEHYATRTTNRGRLTGTGNNTSEQFLARTQM